MRLSDDELRDVLTRAEEIQRSSRSVDTMQSEIEAVIGAGEAVGLERAAIERALRERFDVTSTPPSAGSLVFAQSADGKYYVAEVVSVSTNDVRVRYLRGSEHTVTPEQLRPAAFLPGEKLVANWPWWGPWTCTVVSYDAARQKVKVTDGWGYIKSFPISEVWQTARKPWSGRLRIAVTWLSVGIGLGAAAGATLVGLLFR
jgi:hypothetical protein